MTQSRQEQYYTLIDELLRCPNGEEPDLYIQIENY